MSFRLGLGSSGFLQVPATSTGDGLVPQFPRGTLRRGGETSQKHGVAGARPLRPRGPSSDFVLDLEPAIHVGVDPAVTLVANSRWRSSSRTLGKLGFPGTRHPCGDRLSRSRLTVYNSLYIPRIRGTD